jgi:hypothetical protein
VDKDEELECPQPGKNLDVDEIMQHVRLAEAKYEDDPLDILGDDSESDLGIGSDSDEEEFQPDFYPEESHPQPTVTVDDEGDDFYDTVQDLPNPGEIDDEREDPKTLVHDTSWSSHQ